MNPTKSEVAFFSTCTREQETPWEPTIMIDGKRIPFNVNPKMLGVVLDTTLSFGEQVKEVTRQATEKLKLMSALAHTEWGWRKRDLMKIYLTFIRSRLDYGAAAWQPWLFETSIKKMDVVQNKAMKIASGQMSRAPVDALRNRCCRLLDNRQ